MTDTRSPIERMIDAATGYDPAKMRQGVVLTCTKCKKSVRSSFDESWPVGTVTILLVCPTCGTGEPEYLNAAGNKLGFE